MSDVLIDENMLPVDRSLSEKQLLELAYSVRNNSNVIVSVFTALFIRSTDRVLLVRLGDYAIGNIGGNPWSLPGGSVDESEKIGAAARRELAEEASVEVPSNSLELAAWIGRPYVRKNDQKGEITLIVTGEVPMQLIAVPSPPETIDAQWIEFCLTIGLRFQVLERVSILYNHCADIGSTGPLWRLEKEKDQKPFLQATAKLCRCELNQK